MPSAAQVDAGQRSAGKKLRVLAVELVAINIHENGEISPSG